MAEIEIEQEILEKLKINFGFENFEPDLNRTSPLYLKFKNILSNSQIKVITIAGTNGKGQCSMTLSHLLTEANKDVALWISPHIYSIRERFNYQNKQITYDELDILISSSLDEIKQFDFKVSYYEFLFYLFLKWIISKKLDYIILEVGLGGQFDAVNHFDADYVLLTSISRDHQAILGNRYDKILFEKLGVTRAEKTLLSSFQLNYLIENCKQYALEHGIKYKNFKFTGSYFERNNQLVFELLKVLDVNANLRREVPVFKGRLEEFIYKSKKMTFIGAHNPDGVRELYSLIREKQLTESDYLISFSNRDKADVITMLKSLIFLSGSKSRLYLTSFEHQKAINFEILEDVAKTLCHNNKIIILKDWKKFLNGIENEKISNSIIVLGSFYFIGEVQHYLFNDK